MVEYPVDAHRHVVAEVLQDEGKQIHCAHWPLNGSVECHEASHVLCHEAAVPGAVFGDLAFLPEVGPRPGSDNQVPSS